jgi:hypothetical protein
VPARVRAGLARAEVDEVDPQVGGVVAEERDRALEPGLRVVGPAPDAVRARVLAAQQVVDRHAEGGAEAQERRERQAALGMLDLGDRARRHPREVAEVVLTELA